MNIGVQEILQWAWGLLVVIIPFVWKEFQKLNASIDSLNKQIAALEKTLASHEQRTRTETQILKTDVYEKFARLDDLQRLENRVDIRLDKISDQLDRLLELAMKKP